MADTVHFKYSNYFLTYSLILLTRLNSRVVESVVWTGYNSSLSTSPSPNEWVHILRGRSWRLAVSTGSVSGSVSRHCQSNWRLLSGLPRCGFYLSDLTCPGKASSATDRRPRRREEDEKKASNRKQQQQTTATEWTNNQLATNNKINQQATEQFQLNLNDVLMHCFTSIAY